jgi:4-aminobutyrate aminotransferase-like enzyme
MCPATTHSPPHLPIPHPSAAAIATFAVLEKEHLVEAAARKGEWLAAELRRLAAAYPRILVDVRGRGLMLGMQFPSEEVRR